MCALIHRHRARPRGFTLIEILVTLVILMIGLLGIAGLMAQGQRASFEAFQRQQALALANDMAERIKANRPGVDSVATTYAAALATPAGTGTTHFPQVATAMSTLTGCTTPECSAAAAVQYDAALWDGLLSGLATEGVSPLLNPRGCVEALDPAASATSAAACSCGRSRQVTSRVSVAWQGNTSTIAPTASTCGAGQYRDPRTGSVDNTYRRLVSVDIYTVIPCACP